MLYDQSADKSNKEVVYSIGHKMMVQFKAVSTKISRPQKQESLDVINVG